MEKPKSSNQVWDCGSALYDSFELNSFQKQLDSAIVSSSRTFSMPRLPSTLPPPPPPQKTHAKAAATASKKISRTFQKVLRAVFRKSKNETQQQAGRDHGDDHEEKKKKRAFVVYEKPNGLSTIPENPEVEDGSKFVRKTVSDRFSAASVGRIYCA